MGLSKTQVSVKHHSASVLTWVLAMFASAPFDNKIEATSNWQVLIAQWSGGINYKTAPGSIFRILYYIILVCLKMCARTC